MTGPIPLMVVTGFLGSGKTTLLNRILGGQPGRRIAVIVNDFGELVIDAKLLMAARDNVVELANGCVCCASQGDFLKGLAQVLDTPRPPEAVLVETSGLADPVPVVRALDDPRLNGLVRLDGVVTLVDAMNFDRNLDRAEVAYNQLVAGDILLVNKCDLVNSTVPELIERGIRTLNPRARIVRCIGANADLEFLLDSGPSRAGECPPVSPDHRHGADFTSVTLASAHPVDPNRFQVFLDRLPVTVFRGKGIFHVAAGDERWIFHQVGDRSTIASGESWKPGEARQTELVFIGRGLDREALLKDLTSCLDKRRGR